MYPPQEHTHKLRQLSWYVHLFPELGTINVQFPETPTQELSYAFKGLGVYIHETQTDMLADCRSPVIADVEAHITEEITQLLKKEDPQSHRATAFKLYQRLNEFIPHLRQVLHWDKHDIYFTYYELDAHSNPYLMISYQQRCNIHHATILTIRDTRSERHTAKETYTDVTLRTIMDPTIQQVYDVLNDTLAKFTFP